LRATARRAGAAARALGRTARPAPQRDTCTRPRLPRKPIAVRRSGSNSLEGLCSGRTIRTRLRSQSSFSSAFERLCRCATAASAPASKPRAPAHAQPRALYAHPVWLRERVHAIPPGPQHSAAQPGVRACADQSRHGSLVVVQIWHGRCIGMCVRCGALRA
jgi:hypothetical protein